jgi:hypothetical protein
MLIQRGEASPSLQPPALLVCGLRRHAEGETITVVKSSTPATPPATVSGQNSNPIQNTQRI